MNKRIDISNVILTTDRLVLREWRESDLDDFYEYARVDGVGQMAGWNPHRSLEESKMILDDFIRAKKTFAIEYQGKAIGSLGIEEYKESDYPELAGLQGREIGYVINKDYWGRGLMPEAVQRVIAYLFEVEKLDFILVGHFDYNKQSRRVIEKCGFQYVKTTDYETRYNTIETSLQYILYNPAGKRHFMEGFDSEDDTLLVQEIYKRSDEESRLTKSKAAQIEFLTNAHYIEKYVKPGAKILDVGAGTGEYSFYFARKGYKVSAVELADANIDVFRQKMKDSDVIELVQGNALDLSQYEEHSFDAVLLFGPLYHLHSDEKKKQCIREAKRVCKPEGKIFFAFISNDIVILTMQQEYPDYLVKGAYDKDTFRLHDEPFVFHTVDRCRELLRECGIEIVHEVASDGVSELMKDLINRMDEASYQQYIRYHFYLCEKRECLGMSNHLLFVGR